MRQIAWLLLALSCGCSKPVVGDRTEPPPSLPPAPRPEPAGEAVGVEAPPVAVVELFTSEGCSSCPPADANLAKIAAEDGVFALSFHVDYWNDLGWVDPYSSPEHSRRQQRYSRVLSGRVYTPQMVVNGRDEVVGSRSRKVRAALRDALEAPSSVALSLTARVAPRDVVVEYVARGATPGAVLNLAVVQSADGVDVQRGENAGRLLSHANVVRAFETVQLDRAPSGRAVLLLPEGVDGAAARVIGFVQDASTLAVRGADKAKMIRK